MHIFGSISLEVESVGRVEGIGEIERLECVERLKSIEKFFLKNIQMNIQDVFASVFNDFG